MEKKSLPLTFLLLLMGAIIVPTLVLAINTVDTGYQLLPRTTMTITAQLNCRIVHNTSLTKAYFVPTKTDNEWLHFRFLTPPEVFTEPCAGCNAYCPGGEGPLHSHCEDGCGGVCPPGCDPGLICDPYTYTCEYPNNGCTPIHSCDYIFCGDNGCGVTCPCRSPQTCIKGACQ